TADHLRARDHHPRSPRSGGTLSKKPLRHLELLQSERVRGLLLGRSEREMKGNNRRQAKHRKRGTQFTLSPSQPCRTRWCAWVFSARVDFSGHPRPPAPHFHHSAAT